MKTPIRIYSNALSKRFILSGLIVASVMILLTPAFADAKRYIVRLADGVDIQAKIAQFQTRSGLILRRPEIATQTRKTGSRKKNGASASRVTLANPLERILFVSVADTSVGIEDIRALIGPSQIIYIEEDYPLTLFNFPTDKYFSQQWYLDNNEQLYISVERIPGFENDRLRADSGLSGEDIGLRAHYVSPYPVRKRPVIAIIDTGVDDLHPELLGQLWLNPDEIPFNGIDDDHNGLIDDFRG